MSYICFLYKYLNTRLIKYLIFLFACVLVVFVVRFNSHAAVLTNVVIERDGTEVRTVKYATRADVTRFVGLISFIYGSFKFDFYDTVEGFWKEEDSNVPYEDVWRMIWSKYMFQKGQSRQELERAKFLAHLILSNCVKDRLMRVYWPTLKNSIASIIKVVIHSRKFTIEARKPVGKMWQDWKITV